MGAEILCVGTELLLGDIVNTNAQYISKKLAHLGIDLYYHTVVGDNGDRLKGALEVALSRSNLIIMTGGMGPTKDDLTKEITAEYFGKKLRFETYIQRRYFKSVIACANQRLVKMSRNQFALVCRDLDQSKGNAYIGLDLDVKDLVNGTLRDVKSLSGGESFLASLSMALGMADMITGSHGSVRIDTMFIDEGFGSLSDEVRNQAIEVLASLSEGSRVIGIISHVSELRSQIDIRLNVTRDAQGSHALWQMDGV